MRLCPLLFAVIASLPARADRKREPPIVPPPAALDVSKILDQFDVYHDGRGHYFLSLPWDRTRKTRDKERLFYGDGKVFYRQPVTGFSRLDRSRREYGIRDPRCSLIGLSHLKLHGDKVAFTCDKRTTALRLLEQDKAAPLLGKAKFFDIYWSRTPHALARDEDGVYYYVDRLRSDDMVDRERRGFRLFRGRLGQLKRLRMRNLVADTRGEIFATDRGELRLLLDKDPKNLGAVWIENKARTRLIWVPIASYQTRRLVYRDLGVYAGIKLHLPADDL